MQHVNHPAKCRLLIVDDHEDTRNLLVRLLSRSYDVSAARCYETAMEQAAQLRPNAVICDIGLPGGRDGLALMRELNRLYGVRGICVSGHRIEDQRLHDAGFVTHLLKPIHFDQLLHAVSRACSNEAEVARVS